MKHKNRKKPVWVQADRKSRKKPVWVQADRKVRKKPVWVQAGRKSSKGPAQVQAGRKSGKGPAQVQADGEGSRQKRVLMAASVASMIGQFNIPNIRLLQELGYEVHVACNFREGNTCDGASIRQLRQELHAMHVGLYQWDCPRDLGLHATGRCLRAYRQLWGLTGRIAFGMVHCHSPIGGALARAVAHHRGIPAIYTAHGFHFYEGAPLRNWLLYYPVEKLLAYWTDVLVTVNKEDYAFAKGNLKAKRIYRIPGVGIDSGKLAQGGLKRCGEFRERLQIPQDGILLLSVGELNENKNHQVVIDALARLQKEDVYYLVCGQGKLRRRLLRHARHLNVGGQVRIPGYVRDVGTAYHAADIFVFPSKREGMPVALMEAMAAGLPCIVSDIRGCRELVDSRGGIRFAQKESGGMGAFASGVHRGGHRFAQKESGGMGAFASGVHRGGVRPAQKESGGMGAFASGVHRGGIRFAQKGDSGLTCEGAIRKMLAWREEDIGKVQDMGSYNREKSRRYGREAVWLKMAGIYQEAAAGGRGQ